MKNRLNVVNLVAILIAVLLFAIAIILWVMHEQGVESGVQAAHVAAANCGATRSAVSPNECRHGAGLL